MAALVGLLVWLNRSFVNGKFLTAEQHRSETEALVKGHDLVVATLNAQHELAMKDRERRGDEWKDAAEKFRLALGEQTEIAKIAVESNKITDHFFATYLPNDGTRGDGVREIAP